MRKQLVSTKMLFGMIKEDTDEEHENIKKKVTSFDEAISAYESSIKVTKHAAKEHSDALLKVSKAFSLFINDSTTSQNLKDCDKSFGEVSLSTRESLLKTYDEALGKSSFEEIKSDLHHIKTLDEKRDAAAKEYKMADVLITEKEAKYKEKNKPLSDSAKYKDMVEDRTQKKEVFQKADELYKEKAKELLSKQESFISKEMKEYLSSTQVFFSHVGKDLESTLNKLKN